MAGILSFDSKKINKLIRQYGVKKTWYCILKTHIASRKQFQYILKHRNFLNIEKLGEDLIKGLSIGEIGVLYEYCLSYADVKNRKDNGQFFTPDDVAILMAEQSRNFPIGKWLDPCSGIGNLSWHLINIHQNKEKFLKENIVLSDLDELALFIARVLFTISFQKNDKNLFNNIENNFVVFDFLSCYDNGQISLFTQGDSLATIPKHNFVIVNPPYLALKKENLNFETAKCSDLYAYFLENIIKTSDGFISVTPQSFTNAGKFKSLRKLLINKFSNLTIYNFDNVPDNLFHGIKFGSKNTNKANSIRASITVALPDDGIRRITSLLRWQSNQRKNMFDVIDLFLSEVEFTENYFPKVNRMLEPVYKTIKNKKTLNSIISSFPTNYPLYIPSTPRYFIPALKKIVQRTSIRTLYFSSKETQEFAYILINSSFMYWWWRVRDGGMTLSLETLKSLPLIDFQVSSNIVHALEQSENDNKIYKTNAGKIQENVKHPLDLLSKIDDFVFPQYSERLLITHKNSELEQLKLEK